MAETILVNLNGSNVEAQGGTSILDLCKEKGISIPTLCYSPQLTPTGACRLCVVEVEDFRTLVASCHTPVAPGMVIQTHSPKVIQTRKMIIELLLSSHPDFCLVCDKANICELRMLAADHGVGIPTFRAKKRYYPIEDDNPYIIRDLSKCVLCFRCVKACQEVKKANVYAIGYRGYSSKIIVDDDQPLNKEVCQQCNICLQYCPVGALLLREERFGRILRKPLIIKG